MKRLYVRIIILTRNVRSWKLNFSFQCNHFVFFLQSQPEPEIMIKEAKVAKATVSMGVASKYKIAQSQNVISFSYTKRENESLMLI